MKNIIITLALLCFAAFSAHAQKDRFKALFIYNFTKNIEWPSTAKTNQFVIGVVGNSQLGDELSTIAQTQKVANLPIKVINYASVEGMDYCNLIYLAPNKSSVLPLLLNHVNGKATLVVTDGKNLAIKGAGISFIQDGEKLRFEISRKNIEKQGLKSSSSLGNLGISID